MIRLADLYLKPVHDAQGKRLGAVHEVSIRNGAVQSLHYGPGSLIERFTGKGAASRIAWDRVRSVASDRITIDH